MPTLRRSLPPAGLAAGLFCAALLASCGRDQPSEDPGILNNIVQKLPPIPVADPRLDREKLLLAALHAASAFAAGVDDVAAQRQLDGKLFELRLRFGCVAAGPTDEVRGWRFDERKRTLRIKVVPDIASADPVVAKVAGEGFEAVEGFWLQRPWLLTAACPQAPESAVDGADAKVQSDDPAKQESEALAPGRRLGIAQFFTKDDSRTARRLHRPYESTTVLDYGQAPSPSGYDFILSGRLRALPDRRVIACVASGSRSPPSCIVSVDIDRAAIERADNRRLVAEWSGG